MAGATRTPAERSGSRSSSSGWPSCSRALRDWTPLVLVALAEGGALAIAEVGKDVIGRARPPESDAVPPFETSPSFPSGHTIEAFVIATSAHC